MSKNPPWFELSLKYHGVAEIKGPHHRDTIIDLLDWADGKKDGKPLQGIRDDETPWCASYECALLEMCGIVSPRSAWARSFGSWGDEMSAPAVGTFCLLERGPTSGHIAQVAGRQGTNRIVLHGGNQSDKVGYAAFDTQRIIGLRWPKFTAKPVGAGFLQLPVFTDLQLSNNEA